MSATLPQIPAGDREGAPRFPPRVPDHELLRPVGRGAYGEVWLARSLTGAFRAVKVVHRHSFDHDRPFEREFEGILKFEPISRTHDSQVDILHVGRGEGCFYYVMELADDQATGGQILPDRYVPRTLKSELAFRGRLPFEDCVRIGMALATALEHLHAHSLVHRDVKPSNIVFINGVPKLADIGLVASVDATRSLVGTEGFAAPEGPGTPRADLYSLGKVLYEMATGKDRHDFPGLPTQLRELPDREGLVELNAVIARACRHDPKDRYVSASAMRADLELLQSGKSLARLHRTQKRLRVAERIGAVVAALAVLVAAGWFWQAGQTRQVRDLAAERSRLVRETTRLAEENRERVVRLNVANGIREMDRRDVATALVWLSEALALATNQPADTAIQRVRIQHLLAEHPRLLHVLPHPASATAAEFGPDAQRLVTGCADGVVRIWDTARDDAPIAAFPLGGTIRHLRYTRDGRRLWVAWHHSAASLGGAAVLEVVTGEPVFAPVGEVTCSELSPDDRWLAVGRTNGIVQILEADSGSVALEAVGHAGLIEQIRFSRDGRQMLTASRDRTVRRWDVASGRPLGAPLDHGLPVAEAIFSPDAIRIATVTVSEEASGPIQFQTWDAAQAAPLLAPLSGWGRRAALAFDGSGRRLLTADREATVRIWDADSHAVVAPRLALNGPVRCPEVSPDGAQVALGTEAGVVEVWDLEAGQPALPPLHNAGRVESVRYNRDGSRLLTASDDGTVKVWDLALAPADRSLQFLSHQDTAAAVSPDGRHLLLGAADVPARLHSVELPALKASEPALPFATNFCIDGVMTFDASGNQWATAYNPMACFRVEDNRGEGTPAAAGLWRRDADGIRHFSLPHPSVVAGAFFHRDGRQLLTAGRDGLTRIWNTADGTLQQSIPRPRSDAAWIAVSPDLRLAVAVCKEAGGWHVVFRQVQTGKPLGGTSKDNPDITAASFSPDGTRVATAGADQQGRIWSARSGELCAPVFKHGGPLTCIEWSPDGQHVLTAGESPEVRVWDASTGELVLSPLRMKNRPVERARFSADGRFIVARSDEDLVRVWDAKTGEPVTPFLPHSDTIRDVFVTATPQLITIQNCGMIRVWDLPPTPVSVSELAEFVGLLAGGPAETTRPAGARAADLAASLRGLRSRRSEWFVRPAEQVAEWHRHAAREPSTLVQTTSALFHLERLAELAPGDPAIQPQLDRLRGQLIPPRDPATPPQLLDLSRAYTRSFDLLQRGEFDGLPRGRQTLGGIEFDLRGIVHLDRRGEPGDAVGPFHPLAVIRVGQRCQRLHFLQATEGSPRVDGSVVARWIIHYADGSSREWPVVYGVHVRDAWWWIHQEPAEATQAVVAWKGRPTRWNRPDLGDVRLFKATWSNPQPDLEITRLEFRMGETALKPFVVAITAE